MWLLLKYFCIANNHSHVTVCQDRSLSLSTHIHVNCSANLCNYCKEQRLDGWQMREIIGKMQAMKFYSFP